MMNPLPSFGHSLINQEETQRRLAIRVNKIEQAPFYSNNYKINERFNEGATKKKILMCVYCHVHGHKKWKLLQTFWKPS